jgi:biopolymer transport protein ExbB
LWRSSFEEAGQLAVTEMQRYLSALATIASAAPLMGLLGTVIGMIEIFSAQGLNTGTESMTDPTAMAHGISVALYNTAFGLMIAIPSLLVWRALRAKVDAYTLELEIEAERFWRHVAPVLCQNSSVGRPNP